MAMFNRNVLVASILLCSTAAFSSDTRDQVSQTVERIETIVKNSGDKLGRPLCNEDRSKVVSSAQSGGFAAVAWRLVGCGGGMGGDHQDFVTIYNGKKPIQTIEIKQEMIESIYNAGDAHDPSFKFQSTYMNDTDAQCCPTGKNEGSIYPNGKTGKWAKYGIAEERLDAQTEQ